MRVYLHCDATLTGGIGHAMRVVALLEAAADAGVASRLAGIIESDLVRRAIARLGIETDPPPRSPQALVDAAGVFGADLLHVDSYEELPGLQAAAQASGILLSSMEDGTWGRRPADVVLDPHPHALTAYRPDSAAAEILAGPAFAPLRLSLLDGFERTRPTRIARVLTLMGGTDPFGAAEPVARRVAKLPGIELVRVVDARGTILPGGGIETASPGDLRGLIQGIDLAVTAAGTSVWEFAALGVPMAVVQVAENQEENYSWLVRTRLALPLGSIKEIRSGRLDSTDLLLDADAAAERAREAARLIDGRGAVRVVAAWARRVAERTGVVVRPARVGDASALFDWRSDPLTRAASRSTGEMSWPGHVDWLVRTLADPDRRLLIAHADGPSVGTVRFDRDGDDWEASITLAAQARGRGLAVPVLRAALTGLLADVPARRVVAAMRPENRASELAFRAAGFTDDPARSEPGMIRLALATA